MFFESEPKCRKTRRSPASRPIVLKQFQAVRRVESHWEDCKQRSLNNVRPDYSSAETSAQLERLEGHVIVHIVKTGARLLRRGLGWRPA
jgi:hypothetical protein